ncbi:sulfite exporter TauE/SafE family protein [Clostridium sp. AWRP]|uniref:sulfite exporter TauE/SafE family protein n=1 Tax=Clostridium sp. AWRP TaxID=2212991 RepID=UPI000FDBC9E1|nr:sulfite exporter TauE/SafE family protein [Clostridium sp. AWRP]AZV57814.1 sulfite exporter TauE/SafE family protein [Clostridium sp. AWRP]
MNNIILFIVIGCIAGILSGLFGIGGGIIIVPALIYLCGFTQLKAQGTSLAILLPPVGILAFIDYYKEGHVDVKAGILICIFLVIGSVLGAKMSHVIPVDIMRKLFGILMVLIAVKFIFGK